MASTFLGLETAKRGLTTQQQALYVTGHNVSNANTEGYSRQRVNFSTTTPYETPGLNRSNTAGQLGTGVTAGSIQRIRDDFADLQYRTQNNSLGYYTSLSESYIKIEEIMNEPSDSNLQTTMNNFWNSLQTLSANAENSGARSVVASNGQMVADSFNYYYNSLTNVQYDIGSEIEVTATEINSILNSISKLNKKISEVEPHGMTPNDLYDSRDVLVDQLSGLMNIKVTNVIPDVYGNVLANAEGLYHIELLRADGTPTGIDLLEVTQAGIGDTSQIEVVNVNGGKVNQNDGMPVDEIRIIGSGESLSGDEMNIGGELTGLIHSYGYVNNAGETKGSYPEMIEKLNNIAKAFAEEFNRIHADGYTLNPPATTNQPDGGNFFEFNNMNPAQSIKVLDTINTDPSKIAAGRGNGEAGNNQNILLLTVLKTKAFSDYGNPPVGMNGNLDSFYAGIIGSLGVDSQSAIKNLGNATTIAASIEERRQSISSVSLDEEMVNMISFQHAYNASSRMITVVDEMLDKIINGMGVVGR